MTTYAFALGRIHTLSIAELIEVFRCNYPDTEILEISKEALIANFSSPIQNPEMLQARLGGTIKIIQIFNPVKRKPGELVDYSILNALTPKYIQQNFLKETTAKIQLGISIYQLSGSEFPGLAQQVAMALKKTLKKAGWSLRLVMPQPPASVLSAVLVQHNHLLTKGAEISIFISPETVYIGKTICFQNFEDYGKRDFARPVRDDKRGMIPPKLAQILLNLAGISDKTTVYDPFCGLGTILQEGLLRGFTVLGSDIDQKAVVGTKQNLEWLAREYQLSSPLYHLNTTPAGKASEFIQSVGFDTASNPVSAIVTEGTLGPIYGRFPTEANIQNNFLTLRDLYVASFQEFGKFLPKGARVIICFPAYKRAKNDYVLFPYLDFLSTLGYNSVRVIPEEILINNHFLAVTSRNSVIYDRPDQVVAREIVIFCKS